MTIGHFHPARTNPRYLRRSRIFNEGFAVFIAGSLFRGFPPWDVQNLSGRRWCRFSAVVSFPDNF